MDHVKDLVNSIVERAHRDIVDAIEEFENTCEDDGYIKDKILIYSQGVTLYTVEIMMKLLGAEKTDRFLHTVMDDVIENILNKENSGEDYE